MLNACFLSRLLEFWYIPDGGAYVTSINKTLGDESPRSALQITIHTTCHSLVMKKCDPTLRGLLEACACFSLDVAPRTFS